MMIYNRQESLNFLPIYQRTQRQLRVGELCDDDVICDGMFHRE